LVACNLRPRVLLYKYRYVWSAMVLCGLVLCVCDAICRGSDVRI
jgi:hypothetical protein